MDKEWADKEWADKECMDKEIHNEEYIPKEPNYYNYKAKNNLLLYFSDEITYFNKVFIICFHIVTVFFINILKYYYYFHIKS